MSLRQRQVPAAPDGVEALPRPVHLTSPQTAPIDTLHLTVLRRLDGLLAGDHAGLLPGHGTERGEARPYVAGDDPRHIDWAVTARTAEPHVRDTIADHELELWLVVDGSASLAFGTGVATKHDVAWSAAGAFALLAAKGGNRIGAITTATDRPMIPARSGRAHVASLLAALRPPPADGATGELAAALERARRTARRRGLVVVVSDFLGPATWERPLRGLGSRHEVVAVQVSDRRERDLPDVGLLAVVDPETGRRRVVDTGDDAVRRRFADAAARRQADITARLAAAGADHLELSTERDWVIDLVRFVASRRTRRQAARPGSRPAPLPSTPRM